MYRLNDKVAVIAGGTGGVGEGIVGAFLAAGGTVIVPSRSPERLRSLRERVAGGERVIGITGDIGTLGGAEHVREEILDRFGMIDAFVASIGGWWHGERILDLPVETWQRVIDETLTAHFIAAKTFLPPMESRGGSYTIIAGLAGERPVPMSGPVSVGAAGLVMLGKVLAEELKHAPVRINELLLGEVITRETPHRLGSRGMTAEQVGEFAALLASDAGVALKGRQFRLVDAASIEEVTLKLG